MGEKIHFQGGNCQNCFASLLKGVYSKRNSFLLDLFSEGGEGGGAGGGGGGGWGAWHAGKQTGSHKNDLPSTEWQKIYQLCPATLI